MRAKAIIIVCALVLIAALGLITQSSLPTLAAASASEVGRYQMVTDKIEIFSQRHLADYILDTATGQVWESAGDNTIKEWRKYILAVPKTK
ncbi:hypothetical protein H6G27_32310 [Nostoc linckia FACHB-104]|nr:hypothetical protein [Nostoc linckia FACHB-104]